MVSLAQGVQGGIIIVFPCAGDQFLEGFFAVFGEAEFLHESDLAGGEAGPGKNDSEGEGGDVANIHGFKTPFHGKGFRWSLRGWFGFAYGGPVSVVQDEDREVPGIVEVARVERGVVETPAQVGVAVLVEARLAVA